MILAIVLAVPVMTAGLVLFCSLAAGSSHPRACASCGRSIELYEGFSDFSRNAYCSRGCVEATVRRVAAH